MRQKLFNKKDHTPQCALCVHAKVIDGDADVLCVREGVVAESDVCRHYEYDPLKRKPTKHRLSGDFSAEDFSL